MTFKKITESPSNHRHLEKMSVQEILMAINSEDRTVPGAVADAIPQIEAFVEATVEKVRNGGRLFYIGAGTSGRLGVLDASECPPTYGVPPDWVIGLIAGGDRALRVSVEDAEDDINQAKIDLDAYDIHKGDIVLGIASSGTTPYVVNGLRQCQEQGIATGCLTCNPGAPVIEAADYPIVVVVGPEFVTGSTRMKSGTAQKLVLNMISTSLMIRLGRVEDNRMVDMALSNAKLVDRGTRMLMHQFDLDYQEANELLMSKGSVRQAAKSLKEK